MFSGCGHQPAKNVVLRKFHDPGDVLQPGRIRVDVMGLSLPPRFKELSQRLGAAAQKHPDWFLKQVENAKPGQPIPYDPMLEMTREEYDEYLALGEKPSAVKTAEATLEISLDKHGVYTLDGGEALKNLTGIKIDLKEDRVTTLFGQLSKRSRVDAGASSLLGLWTGVE